MQLFANRKILRALLAILFQIENRLDRLRLHKILQHLNCPLENKSCRVQILVSRLSFKTARRDISRRAVCRLVAATCTLHEAHVGRFKQAVYFRPSKNNYSNLLSYRELPSSNPVATFGVRQLVRVLIGASGLNPKPLSHARPCSR